MEKLKAIARKMKTILGTQGVISIADANADLQDYIRKHSSELSPDLLRLASALDWAIRETVWY